MENRIGRKKKVSTTIYLYPEQLDELKKISEDSGIPMAFLIRKAVDRFLKTMKNKKNYRR
jgi:predicted DNA-binding protein